MVRRFRKSCLIAAAMGAAFAGVAPRPAVAYQIDCAILLCLAGGFPASEPCTRAHAEIIRRITPWPIEPPLQLWRCPMQARFPMSERARPLLIEAVFRPLSLAKPIEQPNSEAQVWQAFGEDVTDYVMAIKVYDLTYRRHRNHDGDCNVTSTFRMGTYDRNWNFHWDRADLGMSPDWFFDTHYSGCSEAWFRGVGMEWRDHEGTTGTERILY